jgi:phage portal protein BeeE
MLAQTPQTSQTSQTFRETMTTSDLLKGIAVMSVLGAGWTIVSSHHWAHFYITVAGIIIFLLVYAVKRVTATRNPPSSE